MSFLVFISLCLILVPSFAEEEVKEIELKETSVITLTEDDFTTKTKKDHWYIKFYAPWCAHCQSLAPTWERLATLSKGVINVGKLDCTVHEDICAIYNVGGFPSIRLLVDGEDHTYIGSRTIEGFVKFYNEKVGGDFKVEVEEKEDIGSEDTDIVVLTEDNFVSETKEGSVLVKFFAPTCLHCKPLEPIWKKLATEQKSNFKTAQIDCTIEYEVCQEYQISGLPTIKLFIDGVEGLYQGERTYKDLVKFVTKEKKAALDGTREAKPRFKPTGASLVVPLTPENFDDITNTGIVAVKFCSLSSGICRRLVSIWDELAETQKDKIVAASVDCTVYSDFCKNQKVLSVPGLKLFIYGKSVFYHGPPNVVSIMGYVNNMQNIFKRKDEEMKKKEIKKEL